ncbi:MAG TPA: 4-hydroxy-tetrahydrodipicolinate reductase [Aestuariivirgaceae bacterium]|jgi:4-hydroxy-tetrahydrodipicolinate reductase
MKIAIAGAAGKMGRVLTRIASETSDIEIAGGLESDKSTYLGADIGELAGIKRLGKSITSNATDLLPEIQCFIDFSSPSATSSLSEVCAKAGLIHIIGTTGLSEQDEARIKAAAKRARIVKSGNMSLGVNLLASLVKKAAEALGEEFDIEILEMHHRQKVDAPSGTAMLLGSSVAEGRSIELKNKSVRVRDGHTGARPSGAIGFATLRGGSVVGEHCVMFAGPAERLEFTHKAESRDIFARGALRAALWAQHKQPGLYGMADVLGLND